jgi:hypothetical protein
MASREKLANVADRQISCPETLRMASKRRTQHRTIVQ